MIGDTAFGLLDLSGVRTFQPQEATLSFPCGCCSIFSNSPQADPWFIREWRPCSQHNAVNVTIPTTIWVDPMSFYGAMPAPRLEPQEPERREIPVNKTRHRIRFENELSLK